MNTQRTNLVSTRQDPLCIHYKTVPEDALITDKAKTISNVEGNPFRGTVKIGQDEHAVSLQYGLHSAVGGYHDGPNPGDMLCAAVAACLDSTIRLIACRLGVSLTQLEITVEANADVRGALMVDNQVAVGFADMHSQVVMQSQAGTSPKLIKALMDAAEHSCVNYQTLIKSISITSDHVITTASDSNNELDKLIA